uniref:Uncharacterized protein n=1 Tax=Oryza sativa subsp. japonica TaxID=39947 RepID=Q8S7B8_ORYSJ|nr:Hypothetical protein [Oryza sativa Japonica Group]
MKQKRRQDGTGERRRSGCSIGTSAIRDDADAWTGSILNILGALKIWGLFGRTARTGPRDAYSPSPSIWTKLGQAIVP